MASDFDRGKYFDKSDDRQKIIMIRRKKNINFVLLAFSLSINWILLAGDWRRGSRTKKKNFHESWFPPPSSISCSHQFYFIPSFFLCHWTFFCLLNFFLNSWQVIPFYFPSFFLQAFFFCLQLSKKKKKKEKQSFISKGLPTENEIRIVELDSKNSGFDENSRSCFAWRRQAFNFSLH